MTDELIDLVAELAEALSAHLVVDYEAKDYQDSPLVERMAQVAALLQANGRSVPCPSPMCSGERLMPVGPWASHDGRHFSCLGR